MLRNSTSQTLFKETNNAESLLDWKGKFADAGCNENLIEYVMQEKIIKDYENLFSAYNKLPPAFKNQIQAPWQLYCLSGEKNAFDKVVASNQEASHKIEEKIKKYNDDIRLIEAALETEKDKKVKQRKEKLQLLKNEVEALSQLKFLRDNSNINPLHYAALSGKPEQIMRAMNLGIPFESKDNNCFTVAHYAALSGNASALNKVLELEKTYGTLPREAVKKGRTILHFAALNGDAKTIESALKFTNDINAEDQYGFSAVDYARANNNQSALLKFAELGMPSEKSLDNFHFAGIEPAKKITKLSVV